ncbi:DUF1850 domain-containing protein [Oceaniglobus roseus]|uniref:DUF1850 domain-containing protein n=1 Tax=Oceaniglobus roseus TaxID=1737570 RepID=UPI000C7E9B25|nr:DUF1850 domain-containing protein [Kandeliimicrobium roseum]
MLAAPDFTLSWTHSVERIEWRETWHVVPDALRLSRAEVRGSGAGMEPGPDARLEDGWWVSEPDLTVPALTLAASGATGGGWRLCADGRCRELGAQPGAPVVITPCAGDPPAAAPDIAG